MAPLSLKDVAALKRFRFERILNEGVHPSNFRLPQSYLRTDPFAHSLALLGTFPDVEDSDTVQPAIVRIEKTVLPASFAPMLVAQFVKEVQYMENTSIVCTSHPPWNGALHRLSSTPGCSDG